MKDFVTARQRLNNPFKKRLFTEAFWISCTFFSITIIIFEVINHV